MKYFSVRALGPALAVAAVLASTTAFARPIAYAGGWMFMNENDQWTNTTSMIYSPTATIGIGPFVDYYHGRAFGTLTGLQFNWLANRWNNPDSQGNLYFLSGFGAASHDGADTRPGGYAGFEGDWESRRYYLSYENRYTDAGDDVKEEFQEKGRIGIAPYVAESGSLHTWLMLEADHYPENRTPWVVTPLVRLFKGEYLAEAGVSSNGRPMFNLMITF